MYACKNRLLHSRERTFPGRPLGPLGRVGRAVLSGPPRKRDPQAAKLNSEAARIIKETPAALDLKWMVPLSTEPKLILIGTVGNPRYPPGPIKSLNYGSLRTHIGKIRENSDTWADALFEYFDNSHRDHSF